MITLLEKEQVTESTRLVYEELEKKYGLVPNLFKSLGHKPEVLHAFVDLYKIISRYDHVAPKMKELAALRAVIMGGSEYCLNFHIPLAKEVGITDEQIAILKEPGGQHNEHFTMIEQIVLHFTDRLTNYPGDITKYDLLELERYYTEDQIYEIVMSVSMSNMMTRIACGLLTPNDIAIK